MLAVIMFAVITFVFVANLFATNATNALDTQPATPVGMVGIVVNC